MIAKTLMFALGGLAIGCGGAVYEITSDADSGDADGGQSDSGTKDGGVRDTGTRDSAGHDSASFACGKTICSGTELCVHQCCGGVPPPCLRVPDGGACPPGTTFEPTCGFGAPGCRPDPCTPPPPFCAPSGDNMCGPPQPGTRDVTCVCG